MSGQILFYSRVRQVETGERQAPILISVKFRVGQVSMVGANRICSGLLECLKFFQRLSSLRESRTGSGGWCFSKPGWGKLTEKD